MTAVRGIILFGLGTFAIYKGWVFHSGQRAWFAYGIGVLAIALGVWRVLRREDRPFG